jgi:aminoglycoside phosphotransferase (APT) family kinase protein
MLKLGILLGSGNVADVYAFGALALKLYKPNAAKASAFREAANLALVDGLGLPVPKVHRVELFSDRWGVVLDRVADSGSAWPVEARNMWSHAASMSRLHASIHTCSGYGLPPLKERLGTKIDKYNIILPALRSRLLERLATLPAGDRVCHGDFHPGNVMGSRTRPMVIDWLDACSGHPTADMCRTYLLLYPQFPDLAEAYIKAYHRETGYQRDAILDWLPVVAAARLAENVQGQQSILMRIAETA